MDTSVQQSVAWPAAEQLPYRTPTTLTNLPVELILLIIDLATDSMPEIVISGCPDTKTKWALKRVNKTLYGLKELHAPSDFFIRQYSDINLDRIKQQRLLTAFGPDRKEERLPCFRCKKFLYRAWFNERDNGAAFFYEGRDVSICLPCSRVDVDVMFHQPHHFFLRQYPDINRDRIKQLRLLTKINSDGNMPCYWCKQFLPSWRFDDQANNQAVFFYEGCKVSFCSACGLKQHELNLDAEGMPL